MTEPSFGDRVLVRPSAGLRVQEHGFIAGRIMPDEWTERAWDDWLHLRYRSGEIMVKPIEASAAEASAAAAVAPTTAKE